MGDFFRDMDMWWRVLFFLVICLERLKCDKLRDEVVTYG